MQTSRIMFTMVHVLAVVVMGYWICSSWPFLLSFSFFLIHSFTLQAHGNLALRTRRVLGIGCLSMVRDRDTVAEFCQTPLSYLVTTGTVLTT
ncbi:hypothetical protein F5141DRAFT_1131352 [Pisolithus sp. B1]|nr:hypothetical protein F5141DRAFT_1131352 [Pisolithus sp. B1]